MSQPVTQKRSLADEDILIVRIILGFLFISIFLIIALLTWNNTHTETTSTAKPHIITTQATP